MRGFTALLTALTCVGTAGQAQDAEDGFWEGWYFGGTVGAYFANIRETETSTATGQLNAQYDYSGDDASFGIHVGHNWQKDALLYGLELGMRTGEDYAAEINVPGNSFFYSSDFIFTLSGKVGYLLRPETNLFATAGYSFGQLDYDWTFRGANELGSVSSTGYSIGAGVEQMVSDEIAIRAGVDYTARDTDTFTTGILPGFEYRGELEQVTFSLGFTYFFGN